MIRSLTKMRARCALATAGGAERGATMTEYALLVTFIAMVALAGVKLLGPTLQALFISFAGSL